MRARTPDQAGYAINSGVRIYYEVLGDGDQRLLPQSMLVTVAGGGHFPHVRDPVRINLVLGQFLSHVEARKVA